MNDMKKVVLTESDLKKLVYETAKKVISQINEVRRPYPTDDYGYYRSPRWNDETLDFMEYDTDAEAEGIQEMIEKVRKELTFSYTIKKAKRMSSLGYSVQSNERFFREDAGNYYYDALAYYLEPKSRETKVPTYTLVLQYQEMSPEEQAADVAKYVEVAVKARYGETYERYKKEFEHQSGIRNRIEGDVESFLGGHEGVTPETVQSMRYVDLIKLDREMKQIGGNPAKGHDGASSNLYYEWGLEDYLKRGKLKDLMVAVADEIQKRRASVKFYNIGYLNQFDPHYKQNPEKVAEWEELKALLKKYDEINGGSYDDHRGDNAYWGEIIDENGELVARYNYKVDSSG